MKRVFLTLIAPLIYLYNAVFRKKLSDSLIYFDIKFDNESCYMKHAGTSSDNVLVASYIMFLSRYFFICDDKQLEPMQKYLIKIFKEKFDSKKFINGIEGLVYDTLSEHERNQLKSLAKSGAVMPAFLSDDDNSGSLGKYQFYLTNQDGVIVSKFFMSPGLDIVLLPRLVFFMFSYINSELASEESKKILQSASLDFVKHFANPEEYRDNSNFIKLPLEVLGKHLKE